MKKGIFLAALLAAANLIALPTANAQLVTGQAYIENGNLAKAREKARAEAMRSFVEQQVGVKINAESEMENFLLVRDHVVAKSEGFVVVKRVVSEKNDGSYFSVTLDLEAGAKPIEMAAADVKTQLQMLDRNSSRGSLDIAVTDETADATWDWSSCLVAALKTQGFGRIKRNDAILKFLAAGSNLKMNKLQLYPELRRVGRMAGSSAKAIVRGSIKLARPAQMLNTGAYVATALAAVEIIGYDSDNVDALTRYATAMGSNPAEAEANAKQQALGEVAAGLAQQASVTVQYEQQGGRREIETTFIFKDVYNRVQDSENILAQLENANCEIDRSVFTADGSFQVAIYTQEYSRLSEAVNSILRNLRAQYPNALNEEYSDVGADKPVIRLGAH